MARLGLDYDSLRRVNPRLVYVSITPFGQDGPYSGYAASDLTLSAMGGQMILQGDTDLPPVRITVPQGWLHTATEAAVAALIAHSITVQTGEGQYVDVSAQAAVVWTGIQAMAYAIQGEDFNRAGATLNLGHMAFPPCLPCADGYWSFCRMAGCWRRPCPGGWRRASLARSGWTEEEWLTWDIRFLRGQPVKYGFTEIMAAVQHRRRHSKEDMWERGLREGVTVAPVNTIEDLAKLDHLRIATTGLKRLCPTGVKLRRPASFASCQRRR